MNPEHHMIGNPNIQGQPEAKTVLFVSDLADNVNEADLEIFFQEFRASIILFQMNRSNKQSDQKSNTNATIIFKENSKADAARKALNLKKLKGKTIRIMWHERDNSIRYSNQGNIFVKNIPSNVTPREFYELFLTFGDIVSAKINEDEDGNHYGYGYIHYYTEDSATKAREFCATNQVWGTLLDVKNFQKKNERLNPMTINKNIYVKNIPLNISESEIKSFFSKYGSITWMKVVDEKQGRFAIISFDSEDSTNRAINTDDKKLLGGQELFVDSLMKKSDRKKLLSNKISDSLYKLNNKFKNCNLHIRNLPLDCKEEDLDAEFSPFGEIQSIKIQKYTLVTKVNNEFKEYPMSRGFGYVCFSTEEAAKKAIDALSGKNLSKFPNSKRPIIVDIFMSKSERQNVFTRLQQNINPSNQKKLPFLNPIQPYGPMNPGYPMFNLHPNLAKHVKFPGHPGQLNNQVNMMYPHPQQTMNKPQQKQPDIISTSSKYEEPDINYLNSLEDDGLRKDYLGEFIFKKVENHEYIRERQMPMDTIGKITGMILGIEDLNEIIEISKDYNQLTTRIQEALDLLEGVSK